VKPFDILTEEDLVVLKVRVRRLEVRMRDEFLAATAELLARPEARLAVDVSHVPRIYSLVIGMLVELNLRATPAGKSLTLIVSAEVLTQVSGMSLDQNMDIREVR